MELYGFAESMQAFCENKLARKNQISEIGKFRNAEEPRPVLRPYSFQHSLWYEMEKDQTAEVLLDRRAAGDLDSATDYYPRI